VLFQREYRERCRGNPVRIPFFVPSLVMSHGSWVLRNDLNTPLCHSELVSESPHEGNNPDEILKQVQDDTLVYVLRSFLSPLPMTHDQ